MTGDDFTWAPREESYASFIDEYTAETLALMASLDVKTAFDVAKPSAASKILSLTGVHGHVVAALLDEMKDVRDTRKMFPPWRRGCSAVRRRGQICIVESRGEVANQGLGTCFRRDS